MFARSADVPFDTPRSETQVKHIHHAESLPPAGGSSEKDKTVTKLLDDEHCSIIAVELRNGERLSRHKAAEPISVLCLSGTGILTAGTDLEDRLKLATGTLLTLQGGVEHEVTAAPALRVLVTKYKEA
jgi:quercetin dioxygenase-like cupin family protein